MRHPQILVYERDGRVAQFIRTQRPQPESGKWRLREPRSLDACLELLKDGGRSVLAIKVGKDVLREFVILERVAWLFPEIDIVVLAETENPALTTLAWELGAVCVLPPPQPHPDLINLLEAVLRPQADAGPAAVVVDDDPAEDAE
jgi:hypothetical protein